MNLSSGTSDDLVYEKAKKTTGIKDAFDKRDSKHNKKKNGIKSALKNCWGERDECKESVHTTFYT